MNEWGLQTYGDPCSGCGFSWSAPMATVTAMIGNAPGTFEALVTGRSGSERVTGLAWPVGAYVGHAGDNLRIWAERLAGVAAGGSRSIAAYDQDSLAQARNYDDMPVGAALWSLARAITDWQEASRMMGQRDGVVIEHPVMGGFSVTDVTRQVAHDLHHHLADVRRILSDQAGSPGNGSGPG